MTLKASQLQAQLGAALEEINRLDTKVQGLVTEVGGLAETITRTEGNIDAEICGIKALHLATRKKRIERENGLRSRLPELTSLRDTLARVAEDRQTPAQDNEIYRIFGSLSASEARGLSMGICFMISTLISELTE